MELQNGSFFTIHYPHHQREDDMSTQFYLEVEGELPDVFAKEIKDALVDVLDRNGLNLEDWEIYCYELGERKEIYSIKE